MIHKKIFNLILISQKKNSLKNNRFKINGDI